MTLSIIMREGIVSILERTPGYEIAFAGWRDEFDTTRPDVDVVIAGMGSATDVGAEAVRHYSNGGIPVVAVISPVLRGEVALAVGAASYVVANLEDESLLFGAISSACGHLEFVPPVESATRFNLSPRELDVLAQVAMGSTDQQVGLTLGISVRTVQSHLDRIREKTGRRRRAELTRLAAELGLVHS